METERAAYLAAFFTSIKYSQNNPWILKSFLHGADIPCYNTKYYGKRPILEKR